MSRCVQNVCRGLSVSLAPPGSVQAAGSTLFLNPFSTTCLWTKTCLAVREGLMGRELDYMLCSYTEKGQSAWGKCGRVNYLGSPVSKTWATLTCQRQACSPAVPEGNGSCFSSDLL